MIQMGGKNIRLQDFSFILHLHSATCYFFVCTHFFKTITLSPLHQTQSQFYPQLTLIITPDFLTRTRPVWWMAGSEDWRATRWLPSSYWPTSLPVLSSETCRRFFHMHFPSLVKQEARTSYSLFYDVEPVEYMYAWVCTSTAELQLLYTAKDYLSRLSK